MVALNSLKREHSVYLRDQKKKYEVQASSLEKDCVINLLEFLQMIQLLMTVVDDAIKFVLEKSRSNHSLTKKIAKNPMN
jgi:L-cysteine desulfidase